MKKIKKRINVIGVLLLSVFLAGGIKTTNLSVVKAETMVINGSYWDSTMEPGYDSKAKSNSSIQLKWGKKKGAVEYRIFRSDAKKSMDQLLDEKLTLTKIATVSGKNTYTDKNLKKNRYYLYRICAYKNVKGAKKLFYQYAVREYTGYAKVEWDDRMLPEYNRHFSPERIKLEFVINCGVRPTGYEIYRKENGKSYKKIGKVKYKHDGNGSFTDNKVKKGTKYSYKVRPYFKAKGKTKYGKYSEAVDCRAVNKCGSYTVDCYRGENAARELILKVTSDENNGNTWLPDTYPVWLKTKQINDSENETVEEETDVVPVEQSADGKTWKKVSSSKIKLEPGKTIYLKLKAKKDIPEKGFEFGEAIAQYECAKKARRWFDIDLENKTATMSLNDN